jgi:peptide/nickel transport system substrate-binding protein
MRRFLICAFLSSLLPAGAADSPRRGGQLRLALQAEPKTFDPYLVADEPSEMVRYLTSGVLLRVNRVTQHPEPELALSWRYLDGGRRVVLRLREGVAFSDGSPFTSRDVCYSFGRLMDPALDSPLADSFGAAKGKIACREQGAQGVSLTLPVPIAGLERLLDGVAIQSARSARKEAAVLGPFVLAEHRAGAYLVLSRNPRYWKKDERGNPLPYLDSIRFDIQRNRDLELLRFRQGELHVVNNLDPELFERVKSEMPNAARSLGASLDTEQLWFNQVPAAPLPPYKKAWFTSTAFRQAVAQAIRKDDLARLVYRGQAVAAFGPVSPANQVWFDRALKARPADPKGSLALLAREGFRLEGKVLRDRAGNTVEFSLVTNAGNKSRERMASLIQQDLAVIGIEVRIAPLDFPALIERIIKTYQYEACLLGMVNDDPDPNGQMNIWLSSGASHAWFPNQPAPATPWEAEIDKLMLAQAAEIDAAKRKQAFDRVQQIAVEQMPVIFLVNRNALVALSPELRNTQPSVLRPQTLWNAERLYFADPTRAAPQ